MERREPINNKWPPLPLGLSIELVPVEKRPTEEEWREFQGGIPTVVQAKVPSGLCIYYVWHNYSSKKYSTIDGALVMTPLSFLRNMGNPSVPQNFKYEEGKIVSREFPTAMSWKNHGLECENNRDPRSPPYPRIGKEPQDLDRWLRSNNITNYQIFRPE